MHLGKVQIINWGVYLNGTYRILAYADFVNIIGNNKRTIKIIADHVLNFCKDMILAVNTRNKLCTWN